MGEFAWNTPGFSQGILFTTGIIAFILELVLLYVGISFCVEAEKAPRRLFFGTAAALFGALGVWISGFITDAPLYQMVCLVVPAFWGTGLLYLLSRLLGVAKLRDRFGGHQRLLVRVLGGLLIIGTGTVYFIIYRGLVFAVLSLAIALKCVIRWLTGGKDSGRVAHTYDDISEKRVDNKKKVRAIKCCLIVSMFLTLLYLTWRIFFTIPYHHGILSMVAAVLLLVVEIIGTVDSFVHYNNMYDLGEYPLPEVPENQFPHVDIFVSTYSESTELLRKTLLACMRMDYPDKEKVHIYLCDDGRREEMHVLADEMGVNYLVRATHEGAKAGNLNHALAHSSSPYVVTFDADMQPRSCFLMRTIPYFVDAELKNRLRSPKKQVKLGFVQTPQSFYDPDLYQYYLYSNGRIPNEQDYFYRYIQVARTKSNSVIYGGSNTVLSRNALNAVGGFYTRAITEDFATGMLIEKKGFVSLGTREPLASGMNPNSLRDLIQQRVRWARGVINTGRKMNIIKSPDLTAAQKINYWSSIWYWYASLRHLLFMLCPILSAIFGVTILRCTLPELLIFWLPMFVMSNISQRLLGYGARTPKWTEIYETSIFPFLLVPIILESFGISLKKFKVTSKSRKGAKTRRRYMLPFLVLIALTLLGIVNCVRVILADGSFGPAVLLFWLFYNLFLLVMSLFFVSGRQNGDPESVSVLMPGVLFVGDKRHACFTSALSERELTLVLKEPPPKDGSVSVELKTERYHTRLELKLLRTYTRRKRRGAARYQCTFEITACDNYDHLLAILYDRVPEFPEKIAVDGGIFEDLRRNLWRRLRPSSANKK